MADRVNSVKADFLIYNGVWIPASGDDVFAEWTDIPETLTETKDNSGVSTRNINPDTTGTLTITCQRESVAHKRLGAAWKAQQVEGAAVVGKPIRHVKLNGDVFSSPDAMIASAPGLVSSRETGTYQWTIHANLLDRVYGAAITDAPVS